MLPCFGVAVYCSISAFSPLSPHFSPIVFLGNKVKEFCCGQVWNLSGSSAVVSIREEAVMEGDRALRSLGGEMAAAGDSSLELLLPWNRCQHPQIRKRLKVSVLQAELRGEEEFAEGNLHSALECLCCAKCPQIPVVMPLSVTINNK